VMDTVDIVDTPPWSVGKPDALVHSVHTVHHVHLLLILRATRNIIPLGTLGLQGDCHGSGHLAEVRA